MRQPGIAYEVCSCNFRTFGAIAVLMGCMPYKYLDHVGDSKVSKQEFHINGWRFVCDNVRIYIALPINP